MPGIIATYQHQNHTDTASLLERMATALEPEQRFSRELYAQDGFGFGRVSLAILNPQPQPVWNSENSVGLVMEGELYDTCQLVTALEQKGFSTGDGSQASLLLHLYLAFGYSCLPMLNGALAAAIWHPEERRLVVFNDRLGLQPLYYTHHAGGLVIGSGVRALLADERTPRKVDRVAIQEFLTFDHILGQRTLLEDVHLLAQGSLLVFQDNTLNIRRYYKLIYPQTYLFKEESVYREELVAHLRRSIQRQNYDHLPVGLLLSGGLDSRVILAELADQGTRQPLQTFTWSIPNSDDARIARELSSKIGTRHHFFELKPDWLLHKAEKAVRITDGMGNLVNLHALATLDEEAALASVIYKGFLGDAMFGFGLRPRFWADYDENTLFDIHLQAYRDYDVLSFDLPTHGWIFSDELLRANGDRLMDDFRTGMLASGVKQLAAQRLYFDFTQRVPRMTLNGVLVVRDRAAVRLPFADNDLLDFSARMPPGLLYERRVMVEAFIEAYPKLARVPIARTGLPMVSCAREMWLRNWQFAKWHLRRKGMEWLVGPPTRPYKDYQSWFRGRLRPWIERTLLDPLTLNRGYYKPESVRQLVADHMSGKNHTVKIGAMMAIELWHRMYLDR